MITKIYINIRNLLFLLIVAFLCGCTQLGPKFIEGSRTEYNIAMSRTEDQQMLLNLVRLRYGDAPYFLEATALNTQFLLAPSAEASTLLDFNGNNSYGLTGKFAYEEKPTVTYSPLRGEDFVREVLSPISLDTIVLLDSSGWSPERVLSLSVENLNGLDNASQASGPTPSDAPTFKKFQEAIKVMGQLQNDRTLIIERLPNSAGLGYLASLNKVAEHDSRILNLASLLNLDNTRTSFPLTNSVSRPNKNSINVRTRSFMGVMYFLSHAVDVPEDHINSGKVKITLDRSGQPFDWAEVTGDLLTIKAQKKQPTNSAVAVEYRNKWFYVNDNDIQSKSTLQLLGQLFALQSKKSVNSAPILTLPIGG